MQRTIGLLDAEGRAGLRLRVLLDLVDGIDIELNRAVYARGAALGYGPTILLQSLRGDLLKAPERLSDDAVFLRALQAVVQLKRLGMDSSSRSPSGGQRTLGAPGEAAGVKLTGVATADEHYEPFCS